VSRCSSSRPLSCSNRYSEDRCRKDHVERHCQVGQKFADQFKVAAYHIAVFGPQNRALINQPNPDSSVKPTRFCLNLTMPSPGLRLREAPVPLSKFAQRSPDCCSYCFPNGSVTYFLLLTQWGDIKRKSDVPHGAPALMVLRTIEGLGRCPVIPSLDSLSRAAEMFSP
jgi:hypothetical protein